MQAATAEKASYMANLGELDAIADMLKSQSSLGSIDFHKETLKAINDCCGGGCLTDKSVYAKKHGVNSYANDNLRIQTDVPHETIVEPISISFGSENLADRLQSTNTGTQESSRPGASVYSIEQQRREPQKDTKATYVSSTAIQEKAVESQTYQKESKTQAYESKAAAYAANANEPLGIIKEKTALASQYQASDAPSQKESADYSNLSNQAQGKSPLTVPAQSYAQSNAIQENINSPEKGRQKYDASSTNSQGAFQKVISVDFGSERRDSQTLDMFLQKYASRFSGLDLNQTSIALALSPKNANMQYSNATEQTAIEKKMDVKAYTASSGQGQILILQQNAHEMNSAKEISSISSEKLEALIQKAANTNHTSIQTTAEQQYQPSQQKYQPKHDNLAQPQAKQYGDEKAKGIEDTNAAKIQYSASQKADSTFNAVKEVQLKENYSTTRAQNRDIEPEQNTAKYNKDSQYVSSLAHSQSPNASVKLHDQVKYPGYEHSPHSNNQNSVLYSKNEEVTRKTEPKRRLDVAEMIDEKTQRPRSSQSSEPKIGLMEKLRSKRGQKQTKRRNKNGTGKKSKSKRNRAKDARSKGSSKIISKRHER